jgi:CRISPR-associated endonuclease Csn1
VVSFYEAVIRANQGLPIIFNNPVEIIDLVLEQNISDEVILNALPEKDWEFLFTMKQNELFVFPNEKTEFNPKEIDLMDPKNKKLISPNLFRVQKIANRDYVFRHHFETTVENSNELKGTSWKREGINGIMNIIKVRTNHLGDIVGVGEY